MHQLKNKLPDPYKQWTANHTATQILTNMEGDLRVKDDQTEENSNDQSSAGEAPRIEPKPPEDISSSSVQSIHDPEAAYRKKGKGTSTQTVNGYHANITETCDEDDPLNMITSVEVVPANVCENEFLATCNRTNRTSTWGRTKPGRTASSQTEATTVCKIENRW